ncbi:MAG: hypothetical protein PWP76_307 [Candidatus Diapherotrites archaeon]|nr:hypothetical protein [Candidatus Diapherotrites archaeon]MDN5366827.1 hypothetical protein [Candidatus Diapherotrites archaeon]
MHQRPSGTGSPHPRRGGGGRPDTGAVEQLAKDLVDFLVKDSPDYVGVIKKLKNSRSVRLSGDTASRTAIRKLFETVNKYYKNAEGSRDYNRVIAKIYASVAHTAARRRDDISRLIQNVADGLLIDSTLDEKERIERFVRFFEVLVSLTG